MGLPGAGKSTLAAALTAELFPNCLWLNADAVREKYNDWDFSVEGRLRQARRMRDLADVATHRFVIADFVAPLEIMRDIFNADLTIWVDTILESIFEDTNSIFEKPEVYDFRITKQDAEKWPNLITKRIKEQG
jgi:adenylylsulfate kinase